MDLSTEKEGAVTRVEVATFTCNAFVRNSRFDGACASENGSAALGVVIHGVGAHFVGVIAGFDVPP